MRGKPELGPTKLTKITWDRVSLCRNPADQDAKIVLVKSVDEEVPAAPEPEAAPVETPAEDAPVVSTELQKAIDDAVLAALSKMTNHPEIMAQAGASVPDDRPADDGGKGAIQDCMRSLVKACNESRTTPKAVKTEVARIAKFHGIEGPELTDDGSSEKFAEAIAAMAAVTSTLQSVVAQVATANAASKPQPQQKSEDAVEAPAAPEISQDLLAAIQSNTQETRNFINMLRRDMGKAPVK